MAEAFLPDGLYRVTTRYLCAGFVMEGGRVIACAPILRKRLGYWKTRAERVVSQDDVSRGLVPASRGE